MIETQSELCTIVFPCITRQHKHEGINREVLTCSINMEVLTCTINMEVLTCAINMEVLTCTIEMEVLTCTINIMGVLTWNY